MQGTRIRKFFRTAFVAIIALCLSLVGCGESSSASDSSSNTAVASPTRTTLLDERPYDINNVDPELFAAGEESVRLCLEQCRATFEFNSEDADAQEMTEALEEYADPIRRAVQKMNYLYAERSDWSFDSQLYYIEVQAFLSFHGDAGSVLGREWANPTSAAGSYIERAMSETTPTTLLDIRLYDIDAVDSRVFEAGEDYLRSSLEIIQTVHELVESGATEQELNDSIMELKEQRDEATARFSELVRSESDWNYETQMYVIEITSFDSSVSQIGKVLASMANTEEVVAPNAPEEPTAAETETDDGEVDPAVREFGESYEAFVDEYVAFMQRYNNASADEQSAMMYDYLDLMQRYADMVEKLDEFSEASDTWNAATLAYWTDLTLRCTQKLLEAY